MATYMTSEHAFKGLIVRKGLDVDVLIVNGTDYTSGAPTGPTGPTGPAFSTASPTFTGTTTVAALTGTGVVSLTNASISMSALPTTDPHVAGRLWSNAGVLTVSAG